MGTREEIRSITYLKARAAHLLKQINHAQRPVVITQKGEARAVLLDPESYDRFRAAIGMLKLIAQSEEAVRADRTESQGSLFKRLERKTRNSMKHASA